MALIFYLGMAALVGWGLWSACRPRAAFVVRISDGVPRIVRGTVTRSFVQDIGEACDRHGVRHGVVRGVERDRRIVLAFSGGMPEACRQQLRNLWSMSGWSAGPRAKRG